LYINFCASKDFVRLRSGLKPPHWKHTRPAKWDVGYEGTAYFLDYVEVRKYLGGFFFSQTNPRLPTLHAQQTFGNGTIMALNEGMCRTQYSNGQVWVDLTGHTVEDLFVAYCATF